MSKLFNDPGFWATEKELETECEGDEYDRPEEKEDYPLHASKDDPRVTNATNAIRKRRNRIKMRQRNRKKKRQAREELISRGPPVLGDKPVLTDDYKAGIFSIPPFGSLFPTREEWKTVCGLPVPFYPHPTAKDAMEADGREAYKRGYYPNEYRARLKFFGVFLEAAALGSVHAQYILAKRYLNLDSLGVMTDHERKIYKDKDDVWPARYDEKMGMYYIKKAVEGRYPEAMCYYGIFILCLPPLPTPQHINDALF